MEGVFEMHKSLAIILSVILIFSLFSVVLAPDVDGKNNFCLQSKRSGYQLHPTYPPISNSSNTKMLILATSIPTLSPKPHQFNHKPLAPTSAPFLSLSSPYTSNPTSTFNSITTTNIRHQTQIHSQTTSIAPQALTARHASKSNSRCRYVNY